MTALRCALHRRRPDRPSRHAAACLRCRAAELRFRQMMRGLASLRDEEEIAPDDLVVRVLARLDTAPPVPRRSNRTVVIAGGTAVAIAAVAVAGIRYRRAVA